VEIGISPGGGAALVDRREGALDARHWGQERRRWEMKGVGGAAVEADSYGLEPSLVIPCRMDRDAYIDG